LRPTRTEDCAGLWGREDRGLTWSEISAARLWSTNNWSMGNSRAVRAPAASRYTPTRGSAVGVRRRVPDKPTEGTVLHRDLEPRGHARNRKKRGGGPSAKRDFEKILGPSCPAHEHSATGPMGLCRAGGGRGGVGVPAAGRAQTYPKPDLPAAFRSSTMWPSRPRADMTSQTDDDDVRFRHHRPGPTSRTAAILIGRTGVQVPQNNDGRGATVLRRLMRRVIRSGQRLLPLLPLSTSTGPIVGELMATFRRKRRMGPVLSVTPGTGRRLSNQSEDEKTSLKKT